MTDKTTTAALAEAVSALVQRHEVGDILVDLVASCAAIYPADAVSVVVRNRGDELELLSASSHRAKELELVSLQHDDGPSRDAMRAGEPVVVTGADAVRRQWGAIGEAIVTAGFLAVHVYPMRWRGRSLGALNLFLSEQVVVGTEATQVGQMLADIATLVVVHSTDVPDDQVTARVHEAITDRSVVEQAKGVLAYQREVDTAHAYELLLEEARSRGETLGAAALRVVRSVAR